MTQSNAQHLVRQSMEQMHQHLARMLQLKENKKANTKANTKFDFDANADALEKAAGRIKPNTD